MAIISCPECGKQISDRAVSCPDCGCPINAAPVAVQPDSSKEVEKLLVLAKRAREASDSKNAKKYYDQILDKDPGNWEAIFFSVYFEASECKIRDIASASSSVANSIYSTFAAIADLPDDSQKDEPIETVITSAETIAILFASSAISHYNQFSSTSNAFGECSNRIVHAGNIYQEIEAGLKKVFPERKKRLAQHQKKYVDFLSSNKRWYNDTFLTNTYARLGEEIKTVDPYYVVPTVQTPSTTSSGGCYVATAVYGSYNCPQVWTLRRYRDNTLAETWYGRAFIKAYYAISPTLVKWFGETQWFKKLWKGKLDRLVSKLQAEGVESTPYQDKNW